MRLAATDMSSWPVVDLVPDGVAAVRLLYRGGVAIEASVSMNAFSFTPPQGPIRQAEAAERRVQALFARGRLTRRQRRRMKRLVTQERRAFQALVPKRVEWLDGEGRVLRRMTSDVAAAHRTVPPAIIIAH